MGGQLVDNIRGGDYIVHDTPLRVYVPSYFKLVGSSWVVYCALNNKNKG